MIYLAKREIFNLAYTGFADQAPSVNIMTRDFLALERLADGGVAELTGGRGIENQPIFGVTVVQQTGDDAAVRRRDLSDMFQSRRQAEAHIASLKMELPLDAGA